MVNIGSIFWTVEVANAADAAAKADRMQESLGRTAEKANQANRAVNRAGRGMGRYENEADSARGTSSRLRGTLGLLNSGFFFLASSIGGLILQVTGLTGVWASLSAAGATLYGWLVAIGGWLAGILPSWAAVVGAAKGFVAWLSAGSAGAIAFAATLGALIGLLGVGILEWTGILDVVRRFGQVLGGQLPGWARDGLLALISVFAGGLAVIGAGIAGFVQGFLRGGLGEGIDQAVASAQRALSIFEGAWTRTLTRVRNFASGFADDIANAVGGSVRAGFNAVVPASVSIPSITVAGRTIGGGSIRLPQLATGGFIDSGGLAMLHAGETVVPADVTRNVNFAQATGGGGGGVNIEEISITIGDQSLDISSLRPSEVRTLAEALAPELGREVEAIISP